MSEEINLEFAGDMVYKTMSPAAFGQLIGSLEVLTRLDDYGPQGILVGTSRARRSKLPKKFHDLLDSKEAVVVLQGVHICGSLLILSARNSRWAQITGAALSLVSNRLFEYRNPFGRDGADQMSGIIWTYRILTACVPNQGRSDDLFLRAVNLQAATSYVAAGAAKAISSTWLSGRALEKIVSTEIYGNTVFSRMIKKYPLLGKILSWSTIVWEAGFPVVYVLPPEGRTVALSLVKAFHAGVAATMGLPRFFWGFSSAHGAVEYVADSEQRRVAGEN
ncbi:hypothetical protein [Acaricomes phytoseiuli]|uniref:hypothetical protein n=1 Tax=Acaricomes phytoseiuli TaxID=291968 RepID=UPI001FE104D8|nr:hypothetical protein [Acaricomes phytoseiuli]